MPTVFTNSSQQNSKRSIVADLNDSVDQLFISHIIIYRSGIILAVYLIALEVIFLVINLLIRLPLGFFISAIGANTLYSLNTFIYIGLIIIKLVFMTVIIFQWLEDYYEIRPGKIIYKAGLLKREEKEFDCPQISKVTLSQGFFGRLFNFGTIILFVANNDLFLLSNIPSPHRNLKLIQKSLGSKRVDITLTDELIEDEK